MINKTKNKICHLTTTHPRYDIRIFVKICLSLAKVGYDLSLIVADDLGYEEKDGIKIHDVGKPNGRLQRMFFTTKRVLQKAILLDADIYHLHDPELLTIALKLRNMGKKVIFDSHEDTPKQLLSKPYLNKFLLKIVAFTFGLFEKIVCRRIDYIIAATPFIREKFLKINRNSIDINNYPILGELSADHTKLKKKQVCYIGVISPIRGCVELVEAMKFVNSDIFLCLAGEISDGAKIEDLENKAGWHRTKYLGFLAREEIKTLLNFSIAGLVTLHPTANYLDSLPIKMFEYMSAGLPVIASNFPLWRKIIEGENCGLCVDPLNPQSIAKAVNWLYEHPEDALKMGKNGQKAVIERYNWGREEKKLLAVYESLVANSEL